MFSIVSASSYVIGSSVPTPNVLYKKFQQETRLLIPQLLLSYGLEMQCQRRRSSTYLCPTSTGVIFCGTGGGTPVLSRVRLYERARLPFFAYILRGALVFRLGRGGIFASPSSILKIPL
jgi:hypothetical protein